MEFLHVVILHLNVGSIMYVWMYYVIALCLYCFIRFLAFSLCFIPIIMMCGCRILIKITYLIGIV